MGDGDSTLAERPAALDQPQETQPTHIGRYRIDRMLGEGGMGRVFEAYDPDLDRTVALKVLQGARDASARARLLREARALARLRHPNVVSVYEVGVAGEIEYIAMELVDGITVHEWLLSKPPRDEIIATFIAAGYGLAAAHEAELVHRDFKPHNVLRTPEGRVVVTDFGLARSAYDVDLEAAPVDAADLGSSLTLTGATLGTPAYMAPEQHGNAAVTAAADQFAFCLALWEALTGARPFDRATQAETRRAIESGPNPAALQRVPRRLRDVLRRGLHVAPHERWPDMTTLLAEIEPPAGWVALQVVARTYFEATVTPRRFLRRWTSQPSRYLQPAWILAIDAILTGLSSLIGHPQVRDPELTVKYADALFDVVGMPVLAIWASVFGIYTGAYICGVRAGWRPATRVAAFETVPYVVVVAVSGAAGALIPSYQSAVNISLGAFVYLVYLWIGTRTIYGVTGWPLVRIVIMSTLASLFAMVAAGFILVAGEALAGGLPNYSIR